MSPRFHLVETNAELQPLLDEIERHTTVAVDTEADSLHHYREKLCLIQLGLGEQQWIVDPLAAGVDVARLLALLETRELLFHGADYDLRLLYRAYHFRPERIFDTMLAAQVLGRHHIGLAALVEEFFGVVLPKKGQKADWSRRPLSDELLEYAADDTRYLARTVELMRQELAAKGRLAWHAELCRRQIVTVRHARPATQEADPWRIKGGKHLTGRAAAVLRELWRWREEAASRADRPPFKVAPPEILLQYALWALDHPHARFDGAPPRPAWLVGSRLKSFNAALEQALALPPAAWPGPPAVRGGARRSQDEELLLGRVLAARDEVARELALDPGVLGPREALREAVHHRSLTLQALLEETSLMDWQARALAPAILPILEQGFSPAGPPPTVASETGLDDPSPSGIE